MIGRLTGQLLLKKPPMLLIDVQGVGYEVFAPMSTFYHLDDDTQVTLITHFVVREDQQTLYGFSTEKERELFRTLIKVSGVGPKLALTILSGIEADQFVHVVNQNDIASLVKIPGIGKKTAERLLVEMRDKLSDWAISSVAASSDNGSQVSQDAISALISLGYKNHDAKRAVEAVYQAGQPSEQVIRLALQQMSRG